jgi:hypothetical protein
MELADVRRNEIPLSPRIGFRPIARTTDSRTVIASVVPGWPSGNSVGLLAPRDSDHVSVLAAMFGSLVSDAVFRMRQSGSNLNWFLLSEHPVPRPEKHTGFDMLVKALVSAAVPLRFQLCDLKRKLLPLTSHEILRIRCIIEAVSAFRLGLASDDLCYFLRDCDHPVAKSTNNAFSRMLDAKGFWRLDKEMDPELRLTVLSIVAFHDLNQKGFDQFIDQNNGEGWMLPETLRLADYGLGHDERANEPQSVASRLGPRFLDWQLGEDVERSRKEWTAHAELIRRIVPMQDPTDDTGQTKPPTEEKAATYNIQGGLF